MFVTSIQSRLRRVALARATPLSIACCTPSVDVPVISMMRYVASLKASLLLGCRGTVGEAYARTAGDVAAPARAKSGAISLPGNARPTKGRARDPAHRAAEVEARDDGGADPRRVPSSGAPAERDRRRRQPHHRTQPGQARARLHARADRAP